MGKTTLANALFNENAAPAANYAQQGRGQSRPQIISRTAAGFTLTVIDAPGLPEDGSNCDLVHHSYCRAFSSCMLLSMYLCIGLHSTDYTFQTLHCILMLSDCTSISGSLGNQVNTYTHGASGYPRCIYILSGHICIL